MIRSALADYIYGKFFQNWFKKELGGNSIAANVVNSLNRSTPIFEVGVVRDDVGRVIMSAKDATATCRELGLDIFCRQVQENLAYIEVHPEVKKILDEKPIFIGAQRELKLLLAVALNFEDPELLRQPVEDPTNGGVMRSADTYEHLYRCYQLF